MNFNQILIYTTLTKNTLIMKRLTIKKRIGRSLTPILNLLFRILQPLGFHLTRNHFYEPIPDTRFLNKSIWLVHSDIPGLDMNPAKQNDFLEKVVPKYISECNFPKNETPSSYEFHFENEFFNALDAEILHCMVRHFKPKRIIEIGSGYSTLVSANAALLNKVKDNITTELECIEPNPNETLVKGFPGLTRITSVPLEKVNLSLFSALEENDILFIDSSHVIKTGNDVIYEYLEIIPRLRTGVLVHLHDIFIPDEYPEKWILDEHKFWTEQYLLQAFLAFNSAFEVIWASSFMALNNKEILENYIPSWKDSYTRMNKRLQKVYLTRDGQNVWPVSLWMRRKT
jgi:predicted O-methyltransferase YrrM